MVILHSRGPSVFVDNKYEKWRTRSTDKISEVISHFASVQSNSVALEGSCQSVVYRSVLVLIRNSWGENKKQQNTIFLIPMSQSNNSIVVFKNVLHFVA